MATQPDPMQATLETLAANTRRYRERSGLTQSKLAVACGVELRHLQRVENAEASPSLAMVVALAGALKVPVASLFRTATLERKGAGRPRGKAVRG